MFVRPENPRSGRISNTGSKRRFLAGQRFSLAMRPKWQFNPVTICRKSAERSNYEARLAAPWFSRATCWKHTRLSLDTSCWAQLAPIVLRHRRWNWSAHHCFSQRWRLWRSSLESPLRGTASETGLAASTHLMKVTCKQKQPPQAFLARKQPDRSPSFLTKPMSFEIASGKPICLRPIFLQPAGRIRFGPNYGTRPAVSLNPIGSNSARTAKRLFFAHTAAHASSWPRPLEYSPSQRHHGRGSLRFTWSMRIPIRPRSSLLRRQRLRFLTVRAITGLLFARTPSSQ